MPYSDAGSENGHVSGFGRFEYLRSLVRFEILNEFGFAGLRLLARRGKHTEDFAHGLVVILSVGAAVIVVRLLGVGSRHHVLLI